MAKALLWLIIALVVIAALYFAVLGAVKLYRSLVREDDLDEAAELRRERELLAAENDRTETLLAKARAARETSR